MKPQVVAWELGKRLSSDAIVSADSRLDQALAATGPVIVEAVVDPFTPPAPAEITRVLLAEVIDIDVGGRRALLRDGSMEYDILIVATGSRHHYFGNDDWEKIAPGLKTVEDATEIRRRIFIAFEAAEKESDPEKLKALLTFVVVGGGPTGVELAGALGEIANDTLRNDFRSIDPSKARILLLEGGERILPSYPFELSARAAVFLEKLGVRVEVNSLVTELNSESVTVKRGETADRIPCRTVIWAAGVQASFLGQVLAKATGTKVDRSKPHQSHAQG